MQLAGKSDGGIGSRIAIIDEEVLRGEINEVRGQRPMLDFGPAEIYGHETRYFSRRVQNDAGQFDDGFMFQLRRDELENSMCK